MKVKETMKVVLYSNDNLYDTGELQKFSGLTLMRILEKRGHEVYLFYDRDITFVNKKIECIKLRKYNSTPPVDEKGFFQFDKCSSELYNIDIDLVLLKHDLPSKVVLAFLEEKLEKKGLPIINGTNVYTTHNKLYCKKFSEHMPVTVFSNRIDELKYAVKTFGKAIIKPLDGGRGRGIHKVTLNDDLDNILNQMTSAETVMIIAQEFLPEVKAGDKRILTLISPVIIDFIPIATRFAPPGHFICNLSACGKRKPNARITSKEHKILEDISETLLNDRVFIAGVDFIGEKMTEINTTNPGFSLTIKERAKLNFDKRLYHFLENFRPIGSQVNR